MGNLRRKKVWPTLTSVVLDELMKPLQRSPIFCVCFCFFSRQTLWALALKHVFFFFCCSPSRQQKQISGSHILTKCVSQKPERSCVCSELAISKQLAWKSHGLACLRKCIIHTFHTSHCSVLDAFTPMGFFFYSWWIERICRTSERQLDGIGGPLAGLSRISAFLNNVH